MKVDKNLEKGRTAISTPRLGFPCKPTKILKAGDMFLTPCTKPFHTAIACLSGHVEIPKADKIFLPFPRIFLPGIL